MTQNRDEFAQRAQPGLVKKSIGDKTILFPQDKGAGGTWMASSDQDQIVCLLNGAFKKHKHQPPYRRSRGLVVLDYFESKDPISFFESYNLNDIEPFTMIVYDQGRLYEWRWDEKEKHLTSKDTTQYHLWASCTLYPPKNQADRIKWFEDWQSRGANIDQSSILDFHQKAGDGDPSFNLVMNRMNIVMTTSITSISRSNKSIDLLHIDLMNNQELMASLAI